MDVNTKRFFWPAIVAPLTFGVAVLIASKFGPVDTFPRANRTVRCTDYFSVMVRKRKTSWFTSQTEFSVRAIDRSGGLVREFAETSPTWNASRMVQAPEFYCDFKN